MAPNGAREARTLPQSRVCGFVGQLDCPFVILSEAKDLPQRESHSFACVCRGFDCEVPLPRLRDRDDQCGFGTRDLSGCSSLLRQLHCSLELWRFFFDAEVVGIKFVNLCHVVGG